MTICFLTNRRNSRTSPSPVRRGGGVAAAVHGTVSSAASHSRSATPAKQTSDNSAGSSYNLSLPRTLYGDDINGNR